MKFGQVIAAKLQSTSVRIEKTRAEFNYRSIQRQVPQGSKVLDVGARSSYLGQLLRERLG